MSNMQEKYFSVNIYTPKGLYFSEVCESVSFMISEGKRENAQGSYGVMKGHADAVFSLAEGNISVKKAGNVIFNAKTSEGFAVMDKGNLKITIEKIYKDFLLERDVI